jgi:pre-mRNA-splicing factor ATP-dependent RNA helicase DHX38/PRP16
LLTRVPQVPAIPAARGGNQRQRVEDTPSRGPGISESARRKLEEHRKARDNQRGGFLNCVLPTNLEIRSTDNSTGEGISARNEQRNDGPRGLGDFQQRLNRDSQGGRNGRSRSAQETGRGSESSRSARNGWDATPRDPSGADGNWGGVRDRRWDAPTPRASRDGRLGDDEDDLGGLGRLDMREWEEEQTQLDRDWYMANEDGTLVSINDIFSATTDDPTDGR